MLKILFVTALVVPLIFTACSTPPSSNQASAQPVSQNNNSRTITCYEKTPTCYVSQGAPGCLTISYDKPANSNGEKTCILPASEKNVTYQWRGTSS